MTAPRPWFVSELLVVVALCGCAGAGVASDAHEADPRHSQERDLVATNSAIDSGGESAWDPLTDDTQRLISMTRSVVTLEGLDRAGNIVGTGTAFFVANDRVATAWHVLQGACTARIRFASGESHAVDGVVWVDWEKDVALLVVRTELKSSAPLRLSRAMPLDGDRVIVVGRAIPGERQCAASYGRVSAPPQSKAMQPEMLYLRVVTAPGWSGAPVLKPNGEVVGISKAGLDGAFTLAMSASIVMSALSESEGSEPVGIQSRSPRGPFGQSQDHAGPRRKISPHLEPVVAAFVRKDFAAAEAAARTVLDESPQDAEAWECLAALMTIQSRHGDAKKALRELTRLRPEFADAHYMLGHCLLQLREYRDAVDAFQSAVRLDPRNPDAHYGLGYALLRAGAIEPSIESFRTTLRLDPSYSAARDGLQSAEAQQSRSR